MLLVLNSCRILLETLVILYHSISNFIDPKPRLQPITRTIHPSTNSVIRLPLKVRSLDSTCTAVAFVRSLLANQFATADAPWCPSNSDVDIFRFVVVQDRSLCSTLPYCFLAPLTTILLTPTALSLACCSPRPTALDSDSTCTAVRIQYSYHTSLFRIYSDPSHQAHYNRCSPLKSYKPISLDATPFSYIIYRICINGFDIARHPQGTFSRFLCTVQQPNVC